MAEGRGPAAAALADTYMEKVAAFVKQERLPGAAAGIVVGDELVWSAGHGYADVGSKRAARLPLLTELTNRLPYPVAAPSVMGTPTVRWNVAELRPLIR